MLYLIDKPLSDVAFRIARRDEDARIVLLQDGVVLDPPLDVPTYAVENDIAVRGIDLPDRIEPITYDELVDMIFDHEVSSFV